MRYSSAGQFIICWYQVVKAQHSTQGRECTIIHVKAFYVFIWLEYPGLDLSIAF
uniref:Uncharacterized protein n=1 Tax=Helianthus annuus TaxID=4232 RepID=A0A251TKI7_HELAN